MLRDLISRLRRLEANATPRDLMTVVVIEPGETEDEAIARADATGHLALAYIVVPAEAPSSEAWLSAANCYH